MTEQTDRYAAVRKRFSPNWAPSISVGDGWDAIIFDLHEKLTAADPTFSYIQIKEKWGGLRVYLTDESKPAVKALLREAEQRARVTCESCGDAGTLHVSARGWYRTLCPSCAAEHEQGYTPYTGINE
jgi:ribosomal protein L37AE/L43A